MLTKHPFFPYFRGFFIRGKNFIFISMVNYSYVIICGVARHGKSFAVYVL